MWLVYDEYDRTKERFFYSLDVAGDWIQDSDDPLTWRIAYID